MDKQKALFKKSKAGDAQSMSKDDALFEALGKQKAKKKKKIIRTVLIIVLVLAIVLGAAVTVLQKKVRSQFGPSGEEVLSAQAKLGTISTLVSGSGRLANVDTETVSVPSGVEVSEILVEFGDNVKEGDVIALVDMASVRTAMKDLQSSIEQLDSDINSAKGDTVDSYITAGVKGRVKIIHAEKGDLVEDIMVEHGALAVLSMDGYMSVEIENSSLSRDDSVSVIRANGSEISASIDSIGAGKVKILVTDNGPEYAEEVTVKDGDGNVVGSGKLNINNPLKVTGYAGKINAVYASLNQQVYSSTYLFYLEDTGTSASYNALLRERSEAEDTLLELLQIQRNNGVTAPISGSIYSVVNLDSEEEGTETITDIITISPDVSMSVTISVDEEDILSLKLGQQADITVSSVSDDTISGTVTEIDKTATDGSYTAVITLDKISGMLAGMRASVDVRIEGVDNAIIIPADALRQTSKGYYVYTTYNEETQEYGGRVDVVPGLSNNNYVEIKSGLNEGDTVYYTEAQDFSNMFGSMGFGAMPGGMGNGGMPNMGSMPSGSGNGNRPSGGNMPSGGFPGGGSMPSGDFPGGGGGMPNFG